MDGNGRTKLGRRALLAAGAAGVAAVAAQALAAPTGVRANDGDPLTIGRTNSGTLETMLHAPSSTGLSVASGGGDGLAGGTSAAAKSGVYGYSMNAEGYGVTGRNTSSGTWGYLGGDHAAVYAEQPNAGGSAAYGFNQGSQVGGGLGAASAGVYGGAPAVLGLFGLVVVGRAAGGVWRLRSCTVEPRRDT